MVLHRRHRIDTKIPTARQLADKKLPVGFETAILWFILFRELDIANECGRRILPSPQDLPLTNSPSTKAALEPTESFQLKGGLFPMTVLELRCVDIDAIAVDLAVKVGESNGMLQESPLLISFDRLASADQSSLGLSDLVKLCRNLDLRPAAVRGASDQMQWEAAAMGLANLPKGRDRPSRESRPLAERQEPAAEAPMDKPEGAPTKTITVPVRSGQQIYARGGDLVILTSVSPGAEVLADGSIHCYGPLRGRALAGVQGDREARIFCSSQEAELVSIGGQYLVDEVLRTSHWKQAVQIYLKAGTITMAPLFTNQ